MIRRSLATFAFAAMVLAPTGPASASSPPSFGGVCDGAVDVGCHPPCRHEDDLDCGMVICTLWIDQACVL